MCRNNAANVRTRCSLPPSAAGLPVSHRRRLFPAARRCWRGHAGMLSASGFSRREFEHTDAEIFGLLEVEDHVLEPHHVAQMGLVGELGIHRHRSTPMCLLGVRELVASCARSSSASGGKDYIETAWGRGYVLREP